MQPPPTRFILFFFLILILTAGGMYIAAAHHDRIFAFIDSFSSTTSTPVAKHQFSDTTLGIAFELPPNFDRASGPLFDTWTTPAERYSQSDHPLAILRSTTSALSLYSLPQLTDFSYSLNPESAASGMRQGTKIYRALGPTNAYLFWLGTAIDRSTPTWHIIEVSAPTIAERTSIIKRVYDSLQPAFSGY